MLVTLRGRVFDLSTFQHPGGNEVIHRASLRPDIDVEPMVRSYHSAARWPHIERSLERFAVSNTPAPPASATCPQCKRIHDANPAEYDYALYETLRRQLEPVMDPTFYTSSPSHRCTSAFQLVLWFACMAVAREATRPVSAAIALVAGASLFGFAFTLMHDASHYALCSSPKANEWWSALSNALLFWHGSYWHEHHVAAHHSFTGDLCRDPDMALLATPARARTLVDRLSNHWSRTLLLLLTAVPAQALTYRASGLGVRSDHARHTTHAVHYVAIACHGAWIAANGVWFAAWYLAALSFSYFVNILGDHHQEATRRAHSPGKCWLARQVCNSGNFMPQRASWLNYAWTRWFGGINYQIEHHLFPRVSSSRLPELAPLVESFCIQHNLPYTSSPTLAQTIASNFRSMVSTYSAPGEDLRLWHTFGPTALETTSR
jgi:fatty acid desaturase